MITENVSTLKINKLTQAQYDREFAAGNIDENALYLTPDDTAETYMTKNNPTGTGSFSLNRKAYSDIGNYSFAEGHNTISSGEASHAEGTQTIASGSDSHAEGFTTEASSIASHSEGYKTIASGYASHAEGGQMNEDHSDTLSNRTISATDYPIIGTVDIAISSTTAQGAQSHAEGTQTFAFGYSSHAEGYQTNALGKYSHAEGGYCGPYERASTASGDNSHAEGKGTLASGEASHAEGEGATASGNVSHAEGSGTEASGKSSHAEGINTKARGHYSHAEGNNTKASGEASHAEGLFTEASREFSHAEGLFTIALGANQHVQGKYNIEDTTNIYAHIVGNGTSSARSNAHTLDWNGNAWFAGGVTATSFNGFTIGKSVPSNAVFTDTKYSAGTGISLSGTTFSNSGVRSIGTGTANGTISVNTNGKAANVAVKGLGSAAYTASTAYATSGHNHDSTYSKTTHNHDGRYLRQYGLNEININSTSGTWTVDISDASHGSVPTPWVNVTQFSSGHFWVQMAIKCDNDSNGNRAQGAVWFRNKYNGAAWSKWRQV